MYIILIERRYCSPTNSNLYHYAGNNPVRYIDPDGRLLRTADGNLKIENTGNIITFNLNTVSGKKTVSYEQVYLFTNKGNKVMAFKNISFNPLWQDSTGENIADGEVSFDLNVSDTMARKLNKQIGYDPTEAINTVLNDEYEITIETKATIAVNKMKNGYLSIKKHIAKRNFIGIKQYFIQTSRESEPILLDKQQRKDFVFYKEAE